MSQHRPRRAQCTKFSLHLLYAQHCGLEFSPSLLGRTPPTLRRFGDKFSAFARASSMVRSIRGPGRSGMAGAGTSCTAPERYQVRFTAPRAMHACMSLPAAACEFERRKHDPKNLIARTESPVYFPRKSLGGKHGLMVESRG